MDPRLPAESITRVKKFNRQNMKTETEIPNRSQEQSRGFQWMLFKPQQHAIRPFASDEQTRLDRHATYNSLSR
jgi:hypothetical protein